jgi:hypothetical protein
MRREYNIPILDMTEMPHKTMTYFRMYCNSFPIVLNINHSFSNFAETLTHFNRIWTIVIYYIYIIIITIIVLLLLCYKVKEKGKGETMGGMGGYLPKYFYRKLKKKSKKVWGVASHTLPYPPIPSLIYTISK